MSPKRLYLDGWTVRLKGDAPGTYSYIVRSASFEGGIWRYEIYSPLKPKHPIIKEENQIACRIEP